MRLIDADELYDSFVEKGQHSKRYKLGQVWELNGEEIRDVISMIPTADAQPVVNGKWIVKKTAIGRNYTVCSICGTDFMFVTPSNTLAKLDMRGTNFCPYCGSKMEEVT